MEVHKNDPEHLSESGGVLNSWKCFDVKAKESHFQFKGFETSALISNSKSKWLKEFDTTD